MIFKDRESAANQLIPKLQKFKNDNPLIVGIPRGAMPMAKIIADSLGADLSAVLVHKIPHPFNVEFAIGSIGISGKIHLQPYAKNNDIPEDYIRGATKIQFRTLKERQKRYGLENLTMKDRTVILVDDGIATGATVIGAISEVRALGAKKVILAAAVSSSDAASEIKHLVDDFIVLDIPPGFYSVGQFFSYFPQVSDQEVISILHGESKYHGLVW